MESKSISATEAERNFSDVINQVRYQLAEFDVTYGKEIVARIVPPTKVASGVPISELDVLFRGLPALEEGDVEAFLQDVAAGLAPVIETPPKWD